MNEIGRQVLRQRLETISETITRVAGFHEPVRTHRLHGSARALRQTAKSCKDVHEEHLARRVTVASVLLFKNPAEPDEALKVLAEITEGLVSKKG